MTATAVLAYAVLADAKARLNITSTDHDSDLTSLCNQVNGWIESYTGRVIGPDPTGSYTQDGFGALENGHLYLFPRGIRALTKLEVAPYTGAAFLTVPATDYFLRPSGPDLQPGWPYTEVWMTNIPSASNTLPYFAPGYDNVRFTGTFGWSAIPDEITQVALNCVVSAYRLRASGGGDSMTIGPDGERTFERVLGYVDRQTITRFRIKLPAVI